MRSTLRRVTVGVVALASVPVLMSGASSAAGTSTAVTMHRTVERTFLDNGKTKVVDKRSISLNVSQTDGLRSLQQIRVSWSGAHPTNGLVPDENSDYAQNEEYSFDLFECRGVDSTKVPVKDRLSPETCWTQYADERFRASYDPYPAWRSDTYATAAERKPIVDAEPTRKQPTTCVDQLLGTEAQRWVPFDTAAGKTLYGGPDGCAGQAPEAAPENLSSLALPSNETFGVSDAKGTGSAEFDVFTDEDHASLGCSQSVPCALVAIPIEGISCDAAGADLPKADRPDASDVSDARSNCESTGNFTPGELLNNVEQSGDPAVDGTLWWSASNWRNRIVVPLHFAPSDDACSLASTATPLDVYGSELMTQATTQWAPHFCLNSKLFDFKHVQTPEPEAANLLNSGSIESAFVSDPPAGGYSNPTVNAPVAVTGFAIAADVDDAKGNPVSVRLDPRLLAKLMTESYPDQPSIKAEYPKTDGVATLSNNPLNITYDPEFRALNPSIPESSADSAATILLLNNQSDVMDALTAYIEADPAARAFLAGKPDPWGMRVNPAYKDITLPTNAWQTRDDFEPLDFYQNNVCLQADPVPYLPLVASPTSQLFSIAQDMEFAISQVQTVCSVPSIDVTSSNGAKLTAQGREYPGHQFMLGLVSLGDAQRYDLRTAALQSQSTVSPATAFTSSSGQTFVSPSNATLQATTKMLKPDATTGTWPIPYDKMRTSSAGAQAYPGTMVVYESTPTTGLPASDAKNYAKLMTFAAGAGQKSGTGQGELPPGFLPMTSANGLAALASYTQRAAAAVAAQHGALPSLTGSGSGSASTASKPGSSTSNGTGSATTGGTAASSAGSASPGSSTSTSVGKTGSNPKLAGTPNPASSGPVASAVVALTRMVSAGPGGALPPILVVVAVVSIGTGIAIRRRGRVSS